MSDNDATNNGGNKACFGGAVCIGGWADATISGGTFTVTNAHAIIGNYCTSTKAKLSFTGGCIANYGTGSLLTILYTAASKPVVSGGYFNKAFNSWVSVKSGYSFVDNPNLSEADQAASALGCTYKVVAQ